MAARRRSCWRWRFSAGEPFFAALAALLYVDRARAAATCWLDRRCVAFGISAIQLLPFLEFVRSSDRAAGWSDALILAHSMPLRDWLRIAVPPNAVATEQQFIPCSTWAWS